MAITKFNTNIINWGIETDGFPFKKLNELEEGKVYVLRGCFTTPDNGYGMGAVLIIDDALINVPQRYVELVQEIRNDPEVIDQIKAGKAGFRYSVFQSAKYKNKGYGIDLLDL